MEENLQVAGMRELLLDFERHEEENLSMDLQIETLQKQAVLINYEALKRENTLLLQEVDALKTGSLDEIGHHLARIRTDLVQSEKKIIRLNTMRPVKEAAEEAAEKAVVAPVVSQDDSLVKELTFIAEQRLVEIAALKKTCSSLELSRLPKPEPFKLQIDSVVTDLNLKIQELIQQNKALAEVKNDIFSRLFEDQALSLEDTIRKLNIEITRLRKDRDALIEKQNPVHTTSLEELRKMNELLRDRVAQLEQSDSQHNELDVDTKLKAELERLGKSWSLLEAECSSLISTIEEKEKALNKVIADVRNWVKLENKA